MNKFLTSLAILLLILAGCENPRTSNPTTYTLSGTITLSSPDPSGHICYAKLVAYGEDATATALYTTTAAFATTSTTYAFTNVAPGTYTLHAFIDMDDSSSSIESALPNSGDYAGTDPEVVITGNTVVNNDQWTLIP